MKQSDKKIFSVKGDEAKTSKMNKTDLPLPFQDVLIIEVIK